MPIFKPQPSFSRGEISPRLYSRSDISHYPLALKECTNFTVMRQGGLTRRTGTEFINEAKNSAQKVRVIDFVFSTEQAYTLEFGHLYMRIYALGGRVENPPGTPVEIVTPYTEDEIFDFQYVQSADVLYIAHPDHFPRKISRTSDTAWTIEEVDFKDGPFGDVNPGTDLDELQLINNPHFDTGAQEWVAFGVGADTYIQFDSALKAVLFVRVSGTTDVGIRQQITTPASSAQHIVHFEVVGAGNVQLSIGTTAGGSDLVGPVSLQPGWHTRQFIPNSGTFWIDFRNVSGSHTSANNSPGVGTCECYNSQAKFMNPNGLDGTITVVAQGHSPFTADDVGRQFRLEYPGREAGWGIITAFNSSSSVTVQVRKRLPAASPTERWRLGAFSEQTGYPGRVGFYQERLAFARTKDKPQTIWFSKSAILEDYGSSVPLLADDGLQFSILSESVNEIQWIKEGTDLLIGTKAGIRSLGPADNANAFAPDNVLQKRHVNYGAADMQPVEVGQATLYVDRYKSGIREAMFSFEADQVIAPEVTILSEHVFARGVLDVAYAQAPLSTLWIVLETGELAGITYEREQEMFATHVHRLGGSFGTDSFAHVESVTTIPGTDGDEVWLVVKRTINGATKRYIERLAQPFSGALEDAFFVDSGLTHNGAATGTFAGLDHLDGEEVAILGDGAVFPNQTVVAGSVTLPDGATVTRASVGLPYTSQMRTLEPDVSRGDGSGLGRRKKIQAVLVDLFETGNIMAKTASGQKAEIVLFRSASDLMDQPVPLQSGFFTVRPDGSWRESPGEIVMFEDAPLPATIRSVTLSLEVEP